MSDIAICVENLSKQYRIGTGRAPYKTLRESLTHALASPLRRLWRREPENRRTGEPAPLPVSPMPRGSVSQENDTIWALKDVSFSVRHGEVLGIVGRNGAGKSTLLKILSRITKPTTGRAEIHGRVGSLLEVGTGFHPELTGRENIYLNGAILGMRKAEIDRKFDEMVAFAEVEKFIDTPVKHYSSGMYVRLAFAVAAHLDPEILLVDEVLAVGDVAFQRKCLGKMDDVARRGRTILFVSHNMEAVRKLCSRGIVLERGIAEAEGPADTVVAHYLRREASEMSARVRLPSGDRDMPGVAVCLTFYTLDGVPQAKFRLGEAWRITLTFELHRPVPHVIAGVGLATIESVPIITYWSRPKDLMPGRYLVHFVCDARLSACDIQFAVGLSSHERSFYYVERVGLVSISDVAQNEQPFRASRTGLLLGSQESEIQPAPTEDLTVSPST